MGISLHGLRHAGPQWPGAELMQQELQCPETWGSDPPPNPHPAARNGELREPAEKRGSVIV